MSTSRGTSPSAWWLPSCPWNFPLAIASWKIGPALACGNTVVVKPAELTPLTALRLAELALDAGIPEGVLQVVVGRGTTVGTALVEHPDVAKVAFTGSTEAGRDVMARASGTIKRVTLELGGKSANVVFADADLERAAASAPVRRVRQRRAGLLRPQPRSWSSARSSTASSSSSWRPPRRWWWAIPRTPPPRWGPLVSADHRARVSGFCRSVPTHELARRRTEPGARRARVGGSRPRSWPRSIPSCRVWREEIFGPVVAVTPFEDEAHAVALANDTPYGLSGSIWTRDSSRALRMAKAVQAGVLSVNSNTSVRVNAPFGGMKQSGFGRELGMEALASFSDIKNVFLSSQG